MDGAQTAFQTIGRCPDGGDQVHDEDDANDDRACDCAGMPSSDESPERQPSWTWLEIGGPSAVEIEGRLQKGGLARQYGGRLRSSGGEAQAMDTSDLRYSRQERQDVRIVISQLQMVNGGVKVDLDGLVWTRELCDGFLIVLCNRSASHASPSSKSEAFLEDSRESRVAQAGRDVILNVGEMKSGCAWCYKL